MLRAFGHRVATGCDMLAVVGSSLKLVKLEPATPNTSQHVATRWPNERNMLRPTMLRYVALACCDRLAGASAFESLYSGQFISTQLIKPILPTNAPPVSLETYPIYNLTLNGSDI